MLEFYYRPLGGFVNNWNIENRANSSKFEQVIDLIFRYFQKIISLPPLKDNFYYLVAGNPTGYYIKHFVNLFNRDPELHSLVLVVNHHSSRL